MPLPMVTCLRQLKVQVLTKHSAAIWSAEYAALWFAPHCNNMLQSSPAVRTPLRLSHHASVDASQGAVLQVTSARELLAAIDAGQQRRHVSSTQMNRESSRSHLVMSVIIEATNLQTQNVTKGKLSFVDLAGSERRASLPSLHAPGLGHPPWPAWRALLAGSSRTHSMLCSLQSVWRLCAFAGSSSVLQTRAFFSIRPTLHHRPPD